MAGLKEFFEKLASDTGLQEKVKAAEDENALLKVITDAGYEVKTEELKMFIEDAAKDVELSDSDLDNVAGGGDVSVDENGNICESFTSKQFAALLKELKIFSHPCSTR